MCKPRLIKPPSARSCFYSSIAIQGLRPATSLVDRCYLCQASGAAQAVDHAVNCGNPRVIQHLGRCTVKDESIARRARTAWSVGLWSGLPRHAEPLLFWNIELPVTEDDRPEPVPGCAHKPADLSACIAESSCHSRSTSHRLPPIMCVPSGDSAARKYTYEGDRIRKSSSDAR